MKYKVKDSNKKWCQIQGKENEMKEKCRPVDSLKRVFCNLALNLSLRL